ncbi:MAG: hypothetical protein LBT43_18655 [Prevotella sp.]|nr:hypothetical protein [Prevotella sp.]
MRNIQYILVVALLLCLFPMPYGYFILVRYAAAIIFAIMAYSYYQQNKKSAAYFWIALTLLFQPIFKIALGRFTWNIVDVLIAVVLLVILWGDKLGEKKKHTVDGIMSDINKKLFPKGLGQIDEETRFLCSSLRNNYSFEDVKRSFLYISSMFLIAQDRSQTGIVTRTLNHPQNRIDRESAILIYQFVAKKALSQNTGIAESDAQTLLDYVNGGFNDGCISDVIPGGYGDYGLTETNPIPVKGILANEAYLSKLRTFKCEELNWERLGSTRASNIERPIDIYHMTTKKGVDMGNIYISPYQNHTSTKAPMRFIHVDSISSNPPYPLYYQQIYNRNLAVDDIKNSQNQILTVTSIGQIIPLLIRFKNGETNDMIKTAKREYLALIKQGYIEAYNNLAIIEDFHHGGNKDLFRKGADAGSLSAYFNLSLEENKDSFDWNKRAIELIKEPMTEIEAILLINMAIRYHCGYGCTVNTLRARELYLKSLSFKSNIVENNLGAILLKNGEKKQAEELFNRAIIKRNNYRHGLDIYEVVAMACQNLELI